MRKKIVLIISICSFFMTSFSAMEQEVKAEPPFDWSQHLQIPPGAGLNTGHQILHFKSVDKPYMKSEAASNFVATHLPKAQRLTSDADVLRFASDTVTLKDGTYLEMGVCTGKTINFIGALNPEKTIHGFDSFEGLPEDWVRADKTFAKGTFAFKDQSFLPPVLHNVRLYKGLFADALPKFKRDILKQTPIAFLHMDADLYSSTRDVFQALGSNIVPGTIIVFDEFYNYPGCEEHEQKAFEEFLNQRKLKAEFLAFNVNHEQVALRISENKY